MRTRGLDCLDRACMRRDPVLSCRTQVLGGLKIGCKRLFLHSPHSSKYLEMSPDCVLDFYVHESCQRSGIGRSLLEVRRMDAGCCVAATCGPVNVREGLRSSVWHASGSLC